MEEASKYNVLDALSFKTFLSFVCAKSSNLYCTSSSDTWNLEEFDYQDTLYIEGVIDGNFLIDLKLYVEDYVAHRGLDILDMLSINDFVSFACFYSKRFYECNGRTKLMDLSDSEDDEEDDENV